MGRVHTACCLLPLEHIGSFQVEKKFQMKHSEQRNKFDKSMHGNPTFTFIQYHSILFSRSLWFLRLESLRRRSAQYSPQRHLVRWVKQPGSDRKSYENPMPLCLLHLASSGFWVLLSWIAKLCSGSNELSAAGNQDIPYQAPSKAVHTADFNQLSTSKSTCGRADWEGKES